MTKGSNGDYNTSSKKLPKNIWRADRIICRLFASRVRQEVADQHRQRIKEAYRRKGRQPSEKFFLQLAEWTVVETNVVSSLVSLKEALLLLKVCWQDIA